MHCPATGLIKISAFMLFVLCPATLMALDETWRRHLKTPADELWRLAQQHEHGEGVNREIDVAIRLYCMAARKGSLEASYQLGWIYANGRGVRRDDRLAAAWFAAPAAAGDKHARRMLARLESGPGAGSPQCRLGDGSEYLPPLQSVPDPDRQLILSWVERLAPTYELQTGLVLAVIETESAFNSRAVSNKNAHGLMQLLPETARRFGVKDIHDPLQNIHGGMAYLRWLLDYFKGDLKLALAAYNAGEKAVDQYRGIPPYRETRNYIRQVLRLYQSPGA